MGGGGGLHQPGVALQDAVRLVAPAEPQLLVALRVPGQRRLRAVHLEMQVVLAAGAPLRDLERTPRAAVEADEHVTDVLGRHRRVLALHVRGARERLDLAERPPAHGDRGGEIGAQLDDALRR